MADLKLDIAFWNYDRTRALADLTIGILGIAATYHTAPIVTHIFEGVIGGQYQVAELGFSYFLRTFLATGESPFVAIPVFPNRSFRHSAIYVNKASGIRTPEDLNGKTIGELALYSHDAWKRARSTLSSPPTVPHYCALRPDRHFLLQGQETPSPGLCDVLIGTIRRALGAAYS